MSKAQKKLFGGFIAILAILGSGYLFLANKPTQVVVGGNETTAAVSADENILVIEIAGEGAGTVEILMRPDLAPLHVERIKELARSGAYDGIVFHRVIDGFMAQTGDVEFGKLEGYDYRMSGMGGSDLPNLPAEFSNITYVEGIIGMARSNDPDSANSQFFIMFDDAGFLDGQYTVIGRVISGMEFVQAIKRGDSGANGSVFEDPDYMATVRVKSDL
ncbi:MAG: peptidylprolyl isomerase [Rhodobacteraceae bacterium]|nr:MAG: peptidylprolyl isomerase [Paracoccaceae bacterium]